MNNWQIYPLTTADQQRHIDQSEYLLSHIQPDDSPILYWNVAQVPALVLGFSQKPGLLNQAALEKLRLPVYHRRAGGTAVLVGPTMLSLDVVLPAGHPLVLPDVVESYRWFGEAWIAALAQLNVEARIVTPIEAQGLRTRLKQPETRSYELLMMRACYGTLSSYEVVVGQRKVVGLDMIRRRHGSLVQAGLLLQWDSEPLAQLLGHTEEEQELLRRGLLERAVGLHSLMGHPANIHAIIAAFERAVTQQELMSGAQ
jgi:lipoate-protein ligase A